MNPQERMKIPRHEIPAQDPEVRKTNYEEVAIGFDEKIAIEEAQRCLQCKNPLCMQGCPVSINIPKFIAEIAKGAMDQAIQTIRTTNSLPAICGRVCPQENQCEKTCVLEKKGKSVAIGALERFIADYDRKNQLSKPEEPAPSTGKKIGIIGAGPAGLTAAGYLAKLGHSVTIFEAFHEAGGVLIYGIPEFRLPKDIVRSEIKALNNLGVEFAFNTLVGRTITIDELLADHYSSLFLAPGAGLPVFMHLPGENLCGVYSSNEFLTRVNLMKAFQFPEVDTPIYCGKKIAVIGGGNTAMDAARTAMRMNPEEVYIIYRRSEKEMPARLEEIHHAKEEGIKFLELTNPVAYYGDDNGWVKEMECIRMELGEPDASGRRRPVAVPGSNFNLPVDTVIVAIGAKTNDLLMRTTTGLETNKWGTLIVNPETQMTSRAGIFAGGDVASDEATVISAMGQGRKAGKAMHEFVMSL